MNQDNIRYKIFESIHATDSKAEAYLFGSRARGDFKPESDWDVLIFVDDNKITVQLINKDVVSW